MTTIGVFTDIHANLLALQAVLAEFDQLGCDTIIHTGDAIAIGPHPAEVLVELRHHSNIVLLTGNHDALFVAGLPPERPAWMGESEYRHQQWTHAQLTDDDRKEISNWPYETRHSLGEADLLFCHYGLDPDGKVFAPIVRDPTPDDLDRLFGKPHADVVFYGHHHPPSDIVGITRYINPGAAGCSHDDLARFILIITDDEGVLQIEHRAVTYDRARLLHDIAQRQMPGREEILPAFFGVRS